MIRRVLVTRPEPGASETAERLQALGFEPVKLPLSESVSLPATKLSDLTDVDLVAVTSANAMRHAAQGLVELLGSTACFAVGDRTAKAAREAGFERVSSAAGHAAKLAALILSHSGEHATIAYICGKVRRPDFEADLAGRGRRVIAVETYDTRPLIPSDAEIEQVFNGQPVDAVLVYSVLAAHQLAHLSGRPPISTLLANAFFFCLSQRIAQVLDVDSGRIRIAARPEQEALFGVLQRGA